MGGAYGMYGTEEKHEGFGGKTQRKRILGKLGPDGV